VKLPCCLVLALALVAPARSQTTEIPTRPGVTQKMLVLTAASPKAVLVLFPGGHGGLQLYSNGSMRWGGSNFLVRVRQGFVDQGFAVVVLDAPSDRQTPPFLRGFRQRPEHVEDVKAVIAWAREAHKVPVWLVGTSRGTQSVAHAATALTGSEGPDGIVLTSSILADDKSLPVQAMPLANLRVPVLVVHHEQDACPHCPFAATQQVMDKLHNAPRKELLAVTGGRTAGDDCLAMAFHGYNGVEQSVVQRIAAWILGT
jgi:pimeloyl-ACP methyl ester carboxylesterase